jgi:hypothetical protein
VKLSTHVTLAPPKGLAIQALDRENRQMHLLTVVRVIVVAGRRILREWLHSWPARGDLTGRFESNELHIVGMQGKITYMISSNLTTFVYSYPISLDGGI